ncbi:helix-turn-helix domain-containing protein [Gynuella sunshinyii]|uniref:helix-turn-helix domain-containing protein n=1 Tax=Gynuella sunshinyii TaxID=1445505 RepID=UPI0005CBBBAB|nr:helix-turn-helix domain-containing protein [Gynuella sunshinyii]
MVGRLLFPLPPVLSQQQFSEYVGVSSDTVRGWVEQRTLPTIKIGRQRYINIVGLTDALNNGKSRFCKGDYKS